jgi:hypothetical protein
LVQGSLSLQALLLGVKVHLAVCLSHASSVQALPSLQASPLPEQDRFPPLVVQMSFGVHGSPSSQVPIEPLDVQSVGLLGPQTWHESPGLTAPRT